MRSSDIDQIEKVIIASGIGTRIQRKAIAQCIRDWHENFRDKRYEEDKEIDND